MPAVSVRREGMGSTEPCANREGTQVENLCYERCLSKSGERRDCRHDRHIRTSNGHRPPHSAETDALRPSTHELRSAYRA